MQLQGDPAFWDHMSGPALLGMSPAAGSKAAGHALPPTTAAYGDRQQVWWHSDSQEFWLLLVGGLTILGMAGASLKVRLFRGRAGASIGNTGEGK